MSADYGVGDRLSDHLDAVVTGDPIGPSSLDPALDATVARFFAADDAPAPPPWLADRLWEEVMVHTAPVDCVLRVPATPAVHGAPVSLRVPYAAQPNRGRSMAAYLATAALTLLTLIGSLMAFGGSHRLLEPEDQVALIPAIDSTPESAIPAAVPAEVILLRATIAELPPTGGTPQLGLYRVVFSPRAVEEVENTPGEAVGHEVFTVETGQVAVDADAAVLVTRAGDRGATSSGAPGDVIVLNPGDQLYAPSGVSFRRRNDGPGPATVLGFMIGSVGDTISVTTSRSWPDLAGVAYIHGLPYALPTEYPSVPAVATVRRLTLAAGNEVAIRELHGLQLVHVEAGTLDLVYAKTETPATPERSFTIGAGSGTENFGRTPEQAVLANRGSEPLVILAASVVPASASEASPRAP